MGINLKSLLVVVATVGRRLNNGWNFSWVMMGLLQLHIAASLQPQVSKLGRRGAEKIINLLDEELLFFFMESGTLLCTLQKSSGEI